MKLVTFRIDTDRNLIIQFLVFLLSYMQQPLILYQIETAPGHIVDQNKMANSYTHLHIDIPHIALNSETYILIRKQECRTSKNIGYKFYYKELFVVKHKSKYICESVIYFDLGPDIIKENCKFAFYLNKPDISQTVLDGGKDIILANWPGDKHIIQNVNNDILVKIPSDPYVLVNRSVS